MINRPKVGDKVHYIPKYNTMPQNGIVKLVKDDVNGSVWVVFNCAGEWEKFMDYTSAMTPLADLREGWVEEDLSDRKPKVKFDIISEGDRSVLIKDAGYPWDEYMTVTNAVEEVVETLADMVGNRQLLFIDSDGNTDEIVIKDGKFDRFRVLPR